MVYVTACSFLRYHRFLYLQVEGKFHIMITLQGDTLYIERPYAKPSVGGQFCLEYGPGTVFYAAPYRPQEVWVVNMWQ